MKQFNLILAAVLLASSIVILAMNLFVTQPIQIVLETGQELTTTNASIFSLTKALIFMLTSFFIGATATYLYYNSGKDSGNENVFSRVKNSAIPEEKYKIIMRLVREDERKVLRILGENNGEVLQNKLVLDLSLSKVKASRLISSLEQKGIIRKERFGLTNKIVFMK